MKKVIMSFIAILFVSISITQATVYHVKTAGNDVNSGTSWNEAFLTLEKALSVVMPGDEIWVAEGTYQPPYGTSFYMVNGVGIYGGFEGHEMLRWEAQPWYNETILQGSGSSVIRNVCDGPYGMNQSAVLSGFTITNGVGSPSMAIFPSGSAGGGIYNFNASPTIERCIIKNCRAEKGGGICNENSSPEIIGCQIMECEASEGGAICNIRSSLYILASDLTECWADNGGGMFNVNSFITMHDSKIGACRAHMNGGGMNNLFSVLYIDRSSILYNIGGRGGGISCGQLGGISGGPLAGILVLTNSIVNQNRANSSGGGIHCSENIPLILKNVLINSNYAQEIGGGIHIENINPVARMSGVTISDNYAWAGGGGIITNSESWLPDFQVYNSIVWGNRSNVQNEDYHNSCGYLWQYHNMYSGLIEYSHSLIEGCIKSGEWNSETGRDNGNNIDGNPLFRDFQLPNANSQYVGDYRLSHGSPAINRGDNDYNPIDFVEELYNGHFKYMLMEQIQMNPQNSGLGLDFEPRIKNEIIDMGAYEYQGLYGIKLYVNHANQRPNKDGLSWATAYNKLEDALNNAKNSLPGIVDAIWVAEGTYQPSSSYTMVEGIKIYGGFSGNETSLAQRNWKNHPTILKGSQTNNAVINNNFSEQTRLTNAAVLDGFIITDGKKGGVSNNYASPVFRNLIIQNNTTPLVTSGGGMNNNYSSPIIESVIIRGNNAKNRGGGIYNNNSSPILKNVLISGNVAVMEGGGICNHTNSYPIFVNATITGNYSNKFGGGLANTATEIVSTIQNCIIWGNNAPTKPNIYNITDSKSECFYSLIEGSDSGWNGLGVDFGYNIDKNPLFKDYKLATNNAPAMEGDYQILCNSPAIDKGNNSFNLLMMDLNDNTRTYNGIIDMGAYEWHGESTRLYVKADNSCVSPNGYSWNSAYSNLTDALNYTKTSGCINEIWVAKGNYQPARDSAFKMIHNIPIYGGFQGSEESLESRNWKTNASILSGNGSSVIRNDFSSENPLTSTAILDGFVIRNGKGSKTNMSQALKGGGIYNKYASPVIRNCIIENCEATSGGGIFNDHSCPTTQNTIIQTNIAIDQGGGIYSTAESFPRFENVTISQNQSGADGGGIYNNSDEGNGHGVCSNTRIIGNKAGGSGGGIYNLSNNSFINTEITGNYTDGYGGGIYHENGKCYLTFVTLSGNYSSLNVGGLIMDAGIMRITNSIIWGNKDKDSEDNVVQNNIYIFDAIEKIRNSLIEGSNGSGSLWAIDGNDAGGNLDVDPEFVYYHMDVTGPSILGDFHLKSSSPAIDKGVDVLLGEDLEGNPRVVNGRPDMGAYEFQSTSKSIIASDTQDEAENPEEELPGTINTAQLSIKVYPNPVQVGNQVMVEIPMTDEDVATQLEVYDILGVQVGKCTVNSTNTSISLPNAKGQYFIKVIGKDGFMQVKKIIVM